MNRYQSALHRLDADLRALGLRWALIGGWAVTVRAQPRTTEDFDVVIVVSGDREAERVAFALRNRGYLYLPEPVLARLGKRLVEPDLQRARSMQQQITLHGF